MARNMMKTFLLVLLISLAVLLVSAILHNLLSGVLKTDEPFFFFLAVFLAPLGVAVGSIGTIILGIKGFLPKKTRTKTKKKVKRARKR